jgi:hypothetical protein
MRFHVLLSASSAREFQRAVGPDHEVVIDTTETAVDLVKKSRGACVVIDPAALETEVFDAVAAVLAARHAAFVIYTRLDTASAARIVSLARLGPHALLLHGEHDGPEVLRTQLAGVLRPTVPGLVLTNAAQRFEHFPATLKAVSVALFSNSPMPRWVDGPVRESGLARRTVDRWMDRAGIRGASTLLDIARIARVWTPIVEQKLQPKHVAVASGYGRLRLLTIHMHRLVGAPVSALGQELDRDDFVQRLTVALIED